MVYIPLKVVAAAAAVVAVVAAVVAVVVIAAPAVVAASTAGIAMAATVATGTTAVELITTAAVAGTISIATSAIARISIEDARISENWDKCEHDKNVDEPEEENEAYERAKERGEKAEKHQDVEITHKNIPMEGEPNSTVDEYKDGELRKRRYYGPDGRAEMDIHYKHGNEHTHTFPHKHYWDWSSGTPEKSAPLSMEE